MPSVIIKFWIFERKKSKIMFDQTLKGSQSNS